MKVARNKKIAYGTATIALWGFFFFVLTASGQEYQPLTAIPGVNTDNPDLISYVNALFLLSIALGAMLAVIKIAIAGFTYMMSDVVTKKDSAKEQITGALIGLGILLATFVVLYTINPNLTNLDVFSGAKRINLNTEPDMRVTNGVGPHCPDGGTLTITTTDGQKTTACVNSGDTPEFTPVTGATFKPLTKDTFYSEVVADGVYLKSNSTVLGEYPSSYTADSSQRDLELTLKSKCTGTLIEAISDTREEARYYCVSNP